MKQIKLLACALSLCAASAGVSAANLWIIGDATPYGWSTDDATALVSTVDNPSIYTGTVYLKANADFKFMTVPDFGNEEYGAAPGATLTDGVIALEKGSDDNGYAKIQVPESANYLLTVDTESMTASIVKSVYQDTEINLASMFMVGDATPNGWSVDNGTPLRQNPDTPYIYAAEKQEMKANTFKIATVIKGAGSWDPKYWYFRDADNAGKIALNQAGDLQWSIEEAGDYNISVNTLDSTIKIEKWTSSSVIEIDAESNTDTEYYNLQGIKIETPANGILIKRRGNKTTKVIVK